MLHMTPRDVPDDCKPGRAELGVAVRTDAVRRSELQPDEMAHALFGEALHEAKPAGLLS